MAILEKAWRQFAPECQNILAGELHYQAMLYHALRVAGAPMAQLGMNVRQQVLDPQTDLYRRKRDSRHEGFRAGPEIIPDVVLFRPEVAGDWRRRRAAESLHHMLVAVEIKASERAGGRIGRSEVLDDIRKLAALRQELHVLGSDMHPVVMVIDVARLAEERMRPAHIAECEAEASAAGVEWRYVSAMS